MAGREGKSEKDIRQMTRKELGEMIQKRFARFDPDIAQFLIDALGAQGDLRPMLAKVLRPMPAEDAGMYDALARFLASQGAQAFWARVEEKKAQPGPSREDKIKRELSGYKPTIIPATRPDDQNVHEPPETGAGQPGAIAEPEGAIEELPEAPPVAPQAPPGPQIAPPTATWDGRERRSDKDRRSGLDRRTGQDRRKEIEMVFKNRRFGGDRRSGLERRSGRDRRQNT